MIDYTKKTSAISNENGITQQRYFASTQNIKECPSNGADLPVLKNSSLASQEKLPDMTANKVQGYGFIPGLWDKIGIVGHRPWAANRAASVPSYTRIPRPPVVLSSTGMPTAPLQFGPVYPAPRQYDLGVQMRPRPDATQGSYGDNIITETPQKSKNEENDKVGTEQQQKHLPKSTSLLIHSIPPKTVGGLQDQLDLNNLSCWCKHKGRRSGSACLKLYCDCFLTGVYCGEKCRCSGSCSNNADETNVHPRTEAIVQALMKDPHAFRLAHNEIALIQKDHRIELMKSSPSSLKAKHRLKASTPSPWSKSYDAVHPVLKKRVDKSIKADKRPPVELLTAQLPPSYYSVPLRVVGGSTILTGLSFSLTHPRDRKKNRAKKPVQSPVKVPVLYSEIATVPSGSIHSRSSIIGPEQKRQRIDDHPGESFRGIEEERMAVFFQSIRAEIKPNEKPWSWFPFEKTQQVAFASYEAVVEDMENVKAAFAAAKTDILTRSYHENRLKRGATQASSESDTLTNADDETDDALRELECDEQIAPNQHVMDDGKVKELTVLAAQDTAILQEMSRIVRRMARELCERRGKNG